MTGVLGLGVVVLLALAFWLGMQFATERARNAAVDAATDAAAAGCPSCAAITGPGARLGAAMATVTRVEHSGDIREDPIEDANRLIRTAASHARRVARVALTSGTGLPVRPEGRRTQ